MAETTTIPPDLLEQIRDYVKAYTVSTDEEGPVTRSDTWACWNLLKRVAALTPRGPMNTPIVCSGCEDTHAYENCPHSRLAPDASVGAASESEIQLGKDPLCPHGRNRSVCKDCTP